MAENDNLLPPPQWNEEAPELTLPQRIELQLIFDTQPQKRAKRMKQLGFELDPEDKDHNRYRPIGSKGPYNGEIDMGGILNFKQYKSNKGGMSELGKDILEGVLDMMVQAPVEAFGDAVGAGAAVSAGVPTLGAGAAPAFVAGRAAGRAAAYNMVEGIKDHMADLIVGEDLPTDYTLRAMQTTAQMVGPEALQKGGQLAVAAAKKGFQLVSSGVRNLMKIGDGKIAKESWDALQSNPFFFGNMENLRKAKGTLDNAVDTLFGTVTTDKGKVRSIEPDSLFQKKLNELETQRAAEVQRLGQNPDASVTVSELLRPLELKMLELQGKKGKSQADLDGIKWLKDKITQIRSDFAPNPQDAAMGINPNRVSFADADGIVKRMQHDLYYNKHSDADWSDAIKGVVDGFVTESGAKVPGINMALKQRAERLGSNYGGIKEQEKKVFDAFEIASRNLDKNNVSRVILGGVDDGAVTGKIADTETRRVTDTMRALDDALGTNLEQEVRTNQILNNIWQAHSQQGTRGSGGTLAAFGAGYIPTDIAGKALGVPEVSALAPVVGATTAMLASPQVGIRAAGVASKAANKLGVLEGNVADPTSMLAHALKLQTMGATDQMTNSFTPAASAINGALGIQEANASVMPKADDLSDLLPPSSATAPPASDDDMADLLPPKR